MKVDALLKIIQDGCRDYEDFLNWDIALEHVDNPENDSNCKDDIIIDSDFGEEWKFIKSHSMGCCTYFTEKKVLGLQVHY